ncbi:ciliary microtubule inner protein 2B-like [Liolophura sinensis]|uniref:ciliary microtubule inner protein 2B-like n=1 Tax=Liolophura sinensis TaxID=3198878 RepID=UPI003157F50C
MTTIAFGGGPSLEQRRSFAALKEGAHVPGYRGYCPQIKYRVGQTYGQDTHDLAKGKHQVKTQYGILSPVVKETIMNRLPESTGDNKYTENMVPGYTGYVPGMTFKFGNTYKEECDSCIDNLITGQRTADMKQADLRSQVASYPRLTAVSYDPHVRDYLNLYRDTHPRQPLMQDDKRAFTEPPMPGYQGYIPRIRPTELGLGCRYHTATKNGLEAFSGETMRHMAKEKTFAGFPTNSMSQDKLSMKVVPGFGRRLYMTDGMIPKYTGYVPQRRYAFGKTYGDTTRSLEVCAHPSSSFGEYVKLKGH